MLAPCITCNAKDPSAPHKNTRNELGRTKNNRERERAREGEREREREREKERERERECVREKGRGERDTKEERIKVAKKICDCR